MLRKNKDFIVFLMCVLTVMLMNWPYALSNQSSFMHNELKPYKSIDTIPKGAVCVYQVTNGEIVVKKIESVNEVSNIVGVVETQGNPMYVTTKGYTLITDTDSVMILQEALQSNKEIPISVIGVEENCMHVLVGVKTPKENMVVKQLKKEINEMQRQKQLLQAEINSMKQEVGREDKDVLSAPIK